MTSPLHAVAVLALALLLDLALGEYPAPAHPVVWMGACVSRLERWAPERGPVRQLAWGIAVALSVPALFGGGAWLAQLGLRRLGWLGVPLEALLLKPTFALRALGEAGRRVQDALQRGALREAREGLRALCSRDPSALEAPQLAAAAVESLAENASDSLVAPLLCYALLGLPGAYAYRAANTLDARLGYHGRYEWLGKASARLDDLWNLVPARLTALLFLAAGGATGLDVVRGVRVLWRDGGKTESPNAGRPMAAMAGLLGVELEKVGHYRLGDAEAPVTAATVGAAWRLVAVAFVLAFGVATAVAGGVRAIR